VLVQQPQNRRFAAASKPSVSCPSKAAKSSSIAADVRFIAELRTPNYQDHRAAMKIYPFQTAPLGRFGASVS